MSRGGRAGGRGVAVPVAPAGSVRTQRAAGAVTSLERHWRRVAPSAALEFSVSLPRSILAQKRASLPLVPPGRASGEGGGGGRGDAGIGRDAGKRRWMLPAVSWESCWLRIGNLWSAAAWPRAGGTRPAG